MLAQAPAAPLMNQLPAGAPGKAAEGGRGLGSGGASVLQLWSDPALATAAFWGASQWMEDGSL